MRLMTLLIVLLVFAVASAVITPPDLVSQLTAMVLMLITYGVVFLAVSRVRSFQQTPESVKKVIVGLVCLLSITAVLSAGLWHQCRQLSLRASEYTPYVDANSVSKE
jgi:uncharacterized membrane protein